MSGTQTAHTRWVMGGFTIAYLAIMGAMLVSVVSLAPLTRHALLFWVCLPTLGLGIVLIIIGWTFARPPKSDGSAHLSDEHLR